MNTQKLEKIQKKINLNMNASRLRKRMIRKMIRRMIKRTIRKMTKKTTKRMAGACSHGEIPSTIITTTTQDGTPSSNSGESEPTLPSLLCSTMPL